MACKLLLKAQAPQLWGANIHPLGTSTTSYILLCQVSGNNTSWIQYEPKAYGIFRWHTWKCRCTNISTSFWACGLVVHNTALVRTSIGGTIDCLQGRHYSPTGSQVSGCSKELNYTTVSIHLLTGGDIQHRDRNLWRIFVPCYCVLEVKGHTSSKTHCPLPTDRETICHQVCQLLLPILFILSACEKQH